MENALYPGSFDPITNGHLDIIKRASKKVEHLYVGILQNPHKDGLFTIEERIELAKKSVEHLENVSIVTFSGLTVHFAQELHATILIRGLRAISDFEYELQLASTNHNIDDEIETLFLMANTKYSYLSSSLVKELAAFDADVSLYVPKNVEMALEKKRNEK